jgi:hypothetical protein
LEKSQNVSDPRGGKKGEIKREQRNGVIIFLSSKAINQSTGWGFKGDVLFAKKKKRIKRRKKIKWFSYLYGVTMQGSSAGRTGSQEQRRKQEIKKPGPTTYLGKTTQLKLTNTKLLLLLLLPIPRSWTVSHVEIIGQVTRRPSPKKSLYQIQLRPLKKGANGRVLIPRTVTSYDQSM